jgi:hypothetical protein
MAYDTSKWITWDELQINVSSELVSKAAGRIANAPCRNRPASGTMSVVPLLCSDSKFTIDVLPRIDVGVKGCTTFRGVLLLTVFPVPFGMVIRRSSTGVIVG